MKTMRVAPKSRRDVALVTDEIARLSAEGKELTISISEAHETVSPRRAAERLGFSRQHVMRLIEWGEIHADRLPGSTYWQIPVSSLLAFEQRQEEARREADDFSRMLDAMGAPLE